MANLSASTNDPWYYALFNYSQVNDVSSYYGQGFGAAVQTLSGAGGNFSGSCVFYNTNYSGTPYLDYDDLVVTTLRSRGITNYNSTQSGPLYQVSGVSNVQMICSGVYSAVTKNPYSPFLISGIKYEGDTF